MAAQTQVPARSPGQPGALKNLLDNVPIGALAGKLVGIVAMGTTDHHYLGVDRHARDVLAFFGAAVTPVSVYLSARDFTDGSPTEAAAADLDAQLEQVAWLARMIGSAPAGPVPLAARVSVRTA